MKFVLPLLGIFLCCFTYTLQAKDLALRNMYRLYNPYTHHHVFTSASGEYRILAKDVGLRDEGVAFSVFERKEAGTAPLFRLYNPNEGHHYYTLSEGERNILVGLGWKYEKVEGYLYPQAYQGTREIFKLYHTGVGDHVYTASKQEKDAAVNNPSGVWQLNTSLGYSSGAQRPKGSPSCSPYFPKLEGADGKVWLGGDTTYSIAISPTRTIWSFQDTYIGQDRNWDRNQAPMVGNSLAVADCVWGKWVIRYVLGRSPFFDVNRYKPDSVLPDPTKKLWPLNPFFAGGKLYFPATLKVEDKNNPFGKTLGVALIRINNPQAPNPESWNMDYLTLADGPTSLGCGAVTDADYAYFFDCRDHNLFLARLPLSKLDSANNLSSLLQPWDGTKFDERTVGRINIYQAAAIPVDANGGFTPRYNRKLKQWQMLYMDSKDFVFSVRVADQLQGPWSAPKKVFNLIEGDAFCYNAYEQVSFEQFPDDEMVFSYTCQRLFDAAGTRARPDLYVPKTACVKNPFTKKGDNELNLCRNYK